MKSQRGESWFTLFALLSVAKAFSNVNNTSGVRHSLQHDAATHQHSPDLDVAGLSELHQGSPNAHHLE